MRISKKSKRERIIGIDPGIERTGVGIIDVANNTPTMVFVTCIETSRELSHDERLSELKRKLERIIKRFNPTRSSIEKLFFSANVKTAMAVAEARGVILVTLQESRLPIDEWTPQQVKLAVTGYGGADKAQVAKLVCAILHLTVMPKPDDAVDALAIALSSQSRTL